MEGPSAGYRWLLAGVFALALAVRVGTTAIFQGLNAPPKAEANPDQVDYELYGARLAAGEGYTLEDGTPTANRPPGTSLAIAPVYLVFGHCYLAGRLWICVLSALTCVATAWLARPLFGPKVALLSAVWLAVYPGHFYYAQHFLSETPAGLWMALACGATVRAIRSGSRGWDVVAGIFWGLTVLTRPHLLLMAPLGLLAAVGSKRRVARQALLQTVVAGLVVAPWVARNAIVMGRPTVATMVAGYTFWGSNNERVLNDPDLAGRWLRTSELRDTEHPLTGTEAEKGDAARGYGIDFVREHLADMPYLCAMKLRRLAEPFPDTPNRTVRLAFAAGWLGTAPFVLLGLFVAGRRGIVPALPLVAAVLSALVFYGSDRFRDANAPVFVVFAALGLAWLTGFAPRPSEEAGR